MKTQPQARKPPAISFAKLWNSLLIEKQYPNPAFYSNCTKERLWNTQISCPYSAFFLVKNSIINIMHHHHYMKLPVGLSNTWTTIRSRLDNPGAPNLCAMTITIMYRL
jgi:hypothetical protein